MSKSERGGERERDREGECRMRNRKTEIQFDRIG